MGSPYVGEIRQFAGNFAPAGWSFCNGATLSIAQNDVLFNLIGTTYGGDGVNTFNLPNLQGRFPIHMGTLSGEGINYVIGQTGGNESVTLLTSQIPSHTHGVDVASVGGSDSPAGNFWAASTAKVYTAAPGTVSMAANSLTVYGGSQPHDNMSPFLTVSYIISLFGIFPSS